jgi:alpha-2-macroglobulin
MNKAVLVLCAMALLWIPQSCSNKKSQTSATAYHPKVSAFTSGSLSNQGAVRVVFSETVASAEPGKQASPSTLSIQPKIKGKLFWEDGQTLVLQPDKLLPSGQKYRARVDLSTLFPNETAPFEFSFEVKQQDFVVEKVNLKPIDISDLKNNVYIGKVRFADFIPSEQAEKVVTVSQNGKKLPITWEHSPNTNEHTFSAENVERTETAGTLTVQWNGKGAGIEKTGAETIEIPALGDFKVMSVSTINTPSQSIQLVFSDPLLPNQDLSGLITVVGSGNVRFSTDVNIVNISIPARITGEVTLNIFPGVKNSLGYPFKETATYKLLFETPKPDVEIIGRGTILPDSKGLILPFKAVSVRAVEVQVIKIFENNVASFLQNNNLNGDEQLRRAGRLIVKKIILLDDNKNIDLTRWNNFALDLSTLISPDPGAIYRVVLTLRRDFSIYPCEGETEQKPIEDKGITEADITYWDTPNPYSYSNWDGYEEDYDYDWRERENPCHQMYYRNRAVSRNVLASNIGMVAKSAGNKEMMVAVSDLVTTEPIPNVELEVYDYQNQLIGRKKSGPDGIARIECSHKPYLIIAKHLRNRGYLRVDESSALSLSRFDIAGQTVKKGLKGFIYGERGVWRPGDTIFVSFMLEDKQNSLPKGHPVVFELTNANGQLVTRQSSQLNETGLYAFRAVTSATAQTGLWTAKVSVGGTMFEKSLRVETVKPNRLKIEMDFGTSIIKAGQSPSAQLQCKWLHGAIARNLKTKVTATLSAGKTKFAAYPDFVFDDPARTFAPEEVTVFEGKLNEQGIAMVKPDLKVSESAPGMLNASFLTRVFEEGGDFSVDRFVVSYSPYNSYVGLRTPQGDKRGMLLTDTTHTVDVVTVDADGKPLVAKQLKVQHLQN